MSRGAVVDVSNVCWSSILPPRIGTKGCVWQRIDTIIDAWRRTHGGEARIVLVADNSLKHYVDGHLRRRWHRIRERYDLLEAPVADEVILDLARNSDLCVISDDRFKEYRKLHEWIEGAPHRFVHWAMRDGDVQFDPSGIAPIPHYLSSELAEAHALRGHRLDPIRDRLIFTKRWRCISLSCLQAQMWHEQLLLWPRLDEQGRVGCPSCGQEVEDVGDRAPLREIIAFDDRGSEELLRFPLEEGPPVVVGRGQLGHGIDLRVAGRDREALTSRVSRQHVLLRLERDGGGHSRVIAVDLGSRNGSSFRRCVRGEVSDAEPVAAGDEFHLRVGDQLVLAKAVRLELSGQRFIAHPAVPQAGTVRAVEPTTVAD